MSYNRLERLKNSLVAALNPSPPPPQSAQPMIGFKLSLNSAHNQLKIKLLACRQLPTNYGAKPIGYTVKICVFPDKLKFETRTVNNAFCANFDQEFVVDYGATRGQFVSLTVYAHLRQMAPPMNRFLNKFTIGPQSSTSMSNRRIIGLVTHNVTLAGFNQRQGGGWVATPDIWRPLNALHAKQGCCKGDVDVVLCYLAQQDILEVSVRKVQFTMRTMEEHEKIGGQLYLKITATNGDVVEKVKSDRFPPTMSMKMAANASALRVQLNAQPIRIQIALMCRPMMKAKLCVGQLEISEESDVWGDVLATPSVPIARTMTLN